MTGIDNDQSHGPVLSVASLKRHKRRIREQKNRNEGSHTRQGSDPAQETS